MWLVDSQKTALFRNRLMHPSRMPSVEPAVSCPAARVCGAARNATTLFLMRDAKLYRAFACVSSVRPNKIKKQSATAAITDAAARTASFVNEC